MPILHLPNLVGPDEVAAAVGRDGAVVVDGVAPPAALPARIESEPRPHLDATATGPDEFSANRTPHYRLADRPFALVSRAVHGCEFSPSAWCCVIWRRWQDETTYDHALHRGAQQTLTGRVGRVH